MNSTRSRIINIITLPNRRQKEVLEGFIPGTGPDPYRGMRELAKHGIKTRTVDLLDFPLNPLARRGTFYAGIDPLRAMKVLLSERKIDAICCGFESGALLISLLRRLVRYKPKLLLFEVNSRGWKVRDQVLDVVMPRADGVMALTEHQKIQTEITYKLKCPPEVVGFAIDDQFFQPQAIASEDYILSVGDDVGRDWNTLVRACDGLSYDVRVRTSAMFPNGSAAKISILGRMSYTDLRNLYARADFVVLPLLDYSNPTGITTLLEAMAMGKAVVTTNGGTTRDIVANGVNGILVPANDPDALRAAMVRVKGSPELRDRLGRAARDTIKTTLSFEQHMLRYATAVKTFIGQDRNPASRMQIGYV
jgi:glycosyltransferase involved in cell wall biosynthesis